MCWTLMDCMSSCCECYAAIGFGSWLRKNVSERSKATSDGRSRSPRHSFIDQDHDDFALGVQVNRRGRSAVRLPRPVVHRNARTVAHRARRKRPIRDGSQVVAPRSIPNEIALGCEASRSFQPRGVETIIRCTGAPVLHLGQLNDDITKEPASTRHRWVADSPAGCS